jgi:hypothetical protein
MATYSFSVSVSYSLTTHHVVFTATQLQVFLTSTNEKVYDQSYENGKDIRCSSNDFQIGTLTASVVFTKTVNMNSRKAKLWIKEVSGANEFIGAEAFDDPGIFNIYNLNQCPVRISKTGTTAFIKCPCESESGPCANSCYQYGE